MTQVQKDFFMTYSSWRKIFHAIFIVCLHENAPALENIMMSYIACLLDEPLKTETKNLEKLPAVYLPDGCQQDEMMSLLAKRILIGNIKSQPQLWQLVKEDYEKFKLGLHLQAALGYQPISKPKTKA